MTLRTKSALVLLATLLIGMVLGSLLHGFVQRQRFRDALSLARPPQLIADIERVIGVEDDARRRAVRSLLEESSGRLRAERLEHALFLRTTLDSHEAALAPLLDEDQRARLRNHLAGHRRVMRRGPPGEGPPPRRPPPPR